MPKHELESAQLFVPGRASYVTTGENGEFGLNLTEASANRARTAAELFDDEFHTSAVFAGGYPGIAQNWPMEHTPPIGSREADFMAIPLTERLRREGWNKASIEERVKKQGLSNNSIGDVVESLREGLIDPNDFHVSTSLHGITLVTGRLHGIRFKDILAKGLDIDPKRIERAAVHDPYGTPATEFRDKEAAPVAVAKELAAIALTKFVLKDVRSGNLQDLEDAEHRFNEIALKNAA